MGDNECGPSKAAWGKRIWLYATAFLRDRVRFEDAEAALREANRNLEKNRIFLDSMIEHLPNMVFVKDAKDLRFVRFNRMGAELLGVRAQDLIGKNDYDLFPKDQADFFTSKDRAVLAGDAVVDIPEEIIRTQRNEERVLHTRKIPIFGPDGKPAYLLGISEDITDAKRAEVNRLQAIRDQAAIEERERAAARLNFLAEASTALATSFDPAVSLYELAQLATRDLAHWCTVTLVREDGRLERVAVANRDPNKEWAVRALEEYQPPQYLAEEGSARSNSIHGVISSGRTMTNSDVRDEDLVAGAQSERHLELMRSLGCTACVIVPIQSHGRVHGAISLISSDPSHRYTSEDVSIAEELGSRAVNALENASLYASAQAAIRARDEFLSIASHELKTPLTSLKLQLQIARRATRPESGEAPPPEKLARMLDLSGTQVNRLVALIDDLLDVSRIESGKLSFAYDRVDIGELVRDMADRYREHLALAGCTIDVTASDGLFVRADRFRLEQVVLNLLSNAAKYGNSAPVELRAEGGAVDEPVRIECHDHGIGIPTSKLEKIFERFERVGSADHISGLGLGLYISSEIVKAHAGRIHVESDFGRGSRFIVELPRNLDL